MSSAVLRFTIIYKRNFEISWNFYKKGINYACTEEWTWCRQICYFLDVSETFLSLNRFANDPLYTLEAAERKYARAISKHMKTYESG